MTRSIPRGKRRDDETDLPPLDDDGDVVGDDAGDALAWDEGEVSLDDAAADDVETGIDIDDRVSGDASFADEADDADVGDLAEGIDTEEGSWTGDESSHSEHDDGSLDEMPGLADGDDAEGLDDASQDVIDERAFGDLSDDVDEPAAEDVFDSVEPERQALAAYGLPEPRGANVVRVGTDGLVLAATKHGDGVLLAGDGVFSLAARSRVAKRVAAGGEDWFASIVSLDERVVLAATLSGVVLRSDDGGASWAEVATLGGEDVGKSAVELIAEAGPSHRTWARAHGGGWFRSDDGGRRWEGPVIPQPVRVAAAIDRSGGVIVATSGWSSQVLRCVDGHRWESVPLKLPGSPTAAACAGDAWAFAFGRNAGIVSLDGGRTVTSWPLLAGASALAWCTTDDGALHLLAAIHDENGDRATLVRAGVDASGNPRGAHRVVDIDGVFERTFDSPGEDGDERVEQLLLLDAAGNRVLFVTPRGVGIVATAGSH